MIYVQKTFLWVFFILSSFCGFIETYEIMFDTNISYSDHLHNFLDHVALIMINYIGFKLSNNSKM